MSNSYRGPALVVLYKMLERTGLTDDEADQFILKLRDEFVDESELSPQSLEDICAAFSETLDERDIITKKRIARNIFSYVVGGLTMGVAGNFLSDALKDGSLLKQASPPKSNIATKETPPAQAPAETNSFGSYIVFFDWDDAKIPPEGCQILEAVAQRHQSFATTRLMVAGHADRSKSSTTNFDLSQRRADAVREYLGSGPIDVRSAI